MTNIVNLTPHPLEFRSSWGLGYELLDAWEGTVTPLTITVREVVSA